MGPSESRRERALRLRARLAYELGGLRCGLRLAWPVLPLWLASLGCCGPSALRLGLGGALAVLALTLGWIGGAAGRGVRPGLWAGGVAALLPVLVKGLQLCGSGGCGLLQPACVLGGLLGGMVLGLQAGRGEDQRPRYLAGAAALAALGGGLGCSLAGLAGVAGMGLGLLCAGAPLVLARRWG